ncbi:MULTISPECIES: LysR substrate-binding domain-containing protein [unclassified Caballeronia]|uniref:LysR substrate-binding domain-containing protein n=1 Tax=unclassified Caballeronia TaxID=2646786 RepID=UPI0028605243|nr:MULTISPECIES: LysR substrate-binding domain-containing protein [unclassified Caballeronia]MDR5777509.1 LysR substrate-binding domain-containing protein [Caballeronia sp. LZ002]MDR5798578.1 LysR substrate-binding domain-containing protein [Caballeronia sp. LZ001]MDR5852951.1 LysR substrate-binding domain-containing protein [Caballeronia sp. LZ003]
MNALVDFEAAVRLGSFTLAANELGVTQAAVSRQIKALEETLGALLFRRLHRAIEPTDAGSELYVVVAESMKKIAGVYDRLASARTQQEFVLATTSAFSHLRLLPRLAQLKKALPDLRLQLTTQMFTADLQHKDIDVAVRFGNGAWADGAATLLFDEEVFPVCSPDWLRSQGACESIDEIAQAPLIESDATSEGWMKWEEWFLALGHRRVRLDFALRCTLYTDAIQAARYGQGIALGWGRLVHDLLKSGDLVRLSAATYKSTDSYYVFVPHGRTITPALDHLIEGLRSDA